MRRLSLAEFPQLRILQISSAQSLGGGERHLADLANGLVRRGHEVHVALRPNSSLAGELGELAPENFHTLPLRNSLDAKSARALASLIRKHKLEIVHAHMARDYPLAAYASRRNPGSKLIVTRHVLFPLNRLHRITLSRAARVIAVSQAVAAQLRAAAIVPAERISVVLNGIDIAKCQRTRAEFDRRSFFESWKLAADTLLVGTVGELTPLKGQGEFLRAASQVLKQVPNSYFIVAGIDHSPGNKHQKQLLRLIEELQLTAHVRLVGWLDELAKLYCALDVFVSASHTESFGLAIAEAMASGTAVVATETAGAVELIKTEETGLLVPVADVNRMAAAILLLLKDETKRLRLGQRAQEVAAVSFGVDRMIDETEAVYKTELGLS